jgi:hypothetical protein
MVTVEDAWPTVLTAATWAAALGLGFLVLAVATALLMLAVYSAFDE